MHPRTTYIPPKPSVIRMDPDCAICHAPAQAACECEAKGLDMAIRQAEDRVMKSIYAEIRSWVRGQAQDYILGYFRVLADRRRDSHAAHIEHIHSQAWYHYNAPPHPQQVLDAEADLKRGIDDAWRSSVERYPEVLEYFFNLVELSLPGDDDPAITDPRALDEPPSAGRRKSGRRTPHLGAGGHEGLPAIGPPTYTNGMAGILPPRTPPPMERVERRPREKRSGRHTMPPPQHAQYAPPQYAPYM